MMDEMTWMFIPVLNVDGYEYTWTNVSNLILKVQTVICMLLNTCTGSFQLLCNFYVRVIKIQ